MWWGFFFVFMVLGTFIIFFFRKSLGMILLLSYSWKSMGGSSHWVGVYLLQRNWGRFQGVEARVSSSTLLPIVSSGLLQSHHWLTLSFPPLLSFPVFAWIFYHSLISFTVFVLSSLSSQAKWQIFLVSVPPSSIVMDALTSAGGNLTDNWTVGFQDLKD